MTLLDELKAQYPWSPELAAQGPPLERTWVFPLAVSPERLWPVLSDTSRMNRAIGLGAMQFSETDGVLEGQALNAGVMQKWQEVPWDWVEGRALMGVRLYTEGFAVAVRALYALERTANGCDLWVSFCWLPRSPAWRIFLGIGAAWLKRRYAAVLQQVEQELKDSALPPSLMGAPVELGPDQRARLRTLSRAVSAVAPAAAVDKLAHHIEVGDALDLHRLRPRALAHRLDVPERDLVLACLHATRAGLLNLTWDLLCPHCRGVRGSPTDLRDVPQRAHCDVCDVEFGADEDNAVEVSFHVHPSIRAVPEVFYCSAEPAHKRHIVLQQRLWPGEQRTMTVPLSPGRWRCRVSGTAQPTWMEVAASGSAALQWRASDPVSQAAGPNPSLTLINDVSDPKTFVIEDARWADDALRPHELFVMPEFRDLFSEQSLGLGVRVSVGEQTILFTDMVGSTWFYENRGDAEAFAEVRRHFAEVFAAIDEAHGCVVKTVGDAVMAAFANPVDALRAARAIQRRFPRQRKDTQVRLRVSVCRGPCLAVTLSSGVDFFGRTVNLAAKLQALTDAQQVAFPAALLEHPGVEALLDEEGTLEPLTLTHAAYAEPVRALRWTL